MDRCCARTLATCTLHKSRRAGTDGTFVEAPPSPGTCRPARSFAFLVPKLRRPRRVRCQPQIPLTNPPRPARSATPAPKQQPPGPARPDPGRSHCLCRVAVRGWKGTDADHRARRRELLGPARLPSCGTCSGCRCPASMSPTSCAAVEGDNHCAASRQQPPDGLEGSAGIYLDSVVRCCPGTIQESARVRPWTSRAAAARVRETPCSAKNAILFPPELLNDSSTRCCADPTSHRRACRRISPAGGIAAEGRRGSGPLGSSLTSGRLSTSADGFIRRHPRRQLSSAAGAARTVLFEPVDFSLQLDHKLQRGLSSVA